MIHAMKAPNAERPYIIHSTTADAGMIRGGDMALAMLGRIDMDVTSDWAKNDPTNIYCLREAAKNILYVVAQSNVMNHVTTYADDTAARNDLGCYMPGDNVDADKLTAASDLFDGIVYELCDGKLPEGLTLNADGTVTGTIAADTADGVYSFKVAVKDGDEFIGKLIAEGTAEKPIVFTSDQPKASRTYGDWGGLILCGKSIVNNTAGEAQIEGGPRSYYGGKDPEDNSGIVKYVRIEFAGYPLEPNKEINGLTCGGVGRGTTIEYVQVSFCGDDSFEWFGGTVNAKHLIAYKGWDDEFDTDYGFQGKLQFLLGVRDPKHADTSKSNGFESDNDADGSNNTPLTTPVFSNVTLIGPFYGESAGKTENDIFYVTEDAANGAKGGSFQAAMHIRRNSSLNVYNSIFVGWPYGLYLQNANVGAVVKNVIFAGMWENFKDETSQNYFQTADLSNLTYASSNDIIAKDGDYTSIVADKIDGADFSDTALNDAFFEKVSYKGAFDGKNDWAANWTNFDPNNTEY